MTVDADVLVAEGREPMPRRRRLALLAVLLLVVVTALVLDQWRRDREAAEVTACRARATEAVTAAGRPLWARTALVRPALANADDDVRAYIYDSMSDVARGRDEPLRAARDACEVTVLWHHHDLRRQRDRCLAQLDAHLAWWGEVRGDGRAAFGPGPGTGGCD